MLKIIQSISPDELAFIAALDYGQHQKTHLEALETLIFRDQCIFNEEQHWFPYEVIELGSHQLYEHHEREFTICTLLVIQAVNIGFDKSTNLVEKLSAKTNEYERLPADLFEAVVEAYATSLGKAD